MAINYVDKSGLAEFWAQIKDRIPTAVSVLTNDAGYITETELSGKGYQTEAQVNSAIMKALSAYGDGNTGAF